MEISFDELFPLVEASPLLDEVELGLRGQGRSDLADALVKLQQDAALEIDWGISGRDDSPPGPETARLWQQYRQITFERLAIFEDVIGLLKDPSLSERVQALKKELPRPACSSHAEMRPHP